MRILDIIKNNLFIQNIAAIIVSRISPFLDFSLALEFVKPSLQEGTIILFDDYIWYKGNKDKGEHGAFKDFKIKFNNIKFR